MLRTWLLDLLPASAYQGISRPLGSQAVGENRSVVNKGGFAALVNIECYKRLLTQHNTTQHNTTHTHALNRTRHTRSALLGQQPACRVP